MRNISVTVILIAFCLTAANCEQFGSESRTSNGAGNGLLGIDDLETGAGNRDSSNLDKRVERYGFGLGRRAYHYTADGGTGVKRLPVYNFGLGKRARPYSFGLGKRSDFENQEYPELDGTINDESIYGLPVSYDTIKRNRPYSFGLGKRDTIEEAMNRRSQAQRYNFGLGRR